MAKPKSTPGKPKKPSAALAAAGIKKYGAKRMAALAAAGRKRSFASKKK